MAPAPLSLKYTPRACSVQDLTDRCPKSALAVRETSPKVLCVCVCACVRVRVINIGGV